MDKTDISTCRDHLVNHDLKVLPDYYADIVCGKKRFELRVNDRDYKLGDTVCLREWNGEFTGYSFLLTIKYVLKDCPEYGLMNGYCIFGW